MVHVLFMSTSLFPSSAARDGRDDIVRVWLDRLPRTRCATVINEGDHQGYTALHYAAMFNRFKIMQLLVTRGAGERAA